MKHISIRLPWHDRGWDGCVCNNPAGNSYCKGFHSINAEKIRGNKDDDTEETLKGKALDASSPYCPPCSETINVFGGTSVDHTFVPPEFIKNTSSKTITIPPGCCGTWPFEGMWDRETGASLDPVSRRASAKVFFDQVEQLGAAGLAFYYCNYDNPVSGEDKKYALAGIARIQKIHPLMEWDDTPVESKEKYGNFIWSRLVENNPAERIRLPYQEYIEKGKDVSAIAVFAEGDLAKSFKYGAHHVSDDDAISMIDRTTAAVKTIIEQKYFEADVMQKWEASLEWLANIRKECWVSRGLYPGLIPVLRFLGMENPEGFIRTRLRDIPPGRIKDYFFDRFDGKENIGVLIDRPLNEAAARYRAMSGSDNENEKIKARLCREKLPFFALDEDQIRNILGDNRGNYCIVSSLENIYENPYVIAEEYVGNNEDDFINFDKIDHGMLPEGLPEPGDMERVSLDDWRRIRALLHTILKNASSNGHSFLEWSAASEKVNKWHKQNDKGTGTFNFDMTTWNQYKAEFAPKIVEDHPDGIFAVYLKKLHEAERVLSKTLRSLMDEEGIEPGNIEWQNIIKGDGKLEAGPEAGEQVNALEKLYVNRLSVLTGAAGTGKTTIIKSLVKGIRQKEPRHNFLLLAPTGKAALILRERIADPGVPVMTIHSLLMKRYWINPFNFTLRPSGGGKEQPSTVIVDECSMIETELFYTLLRTLDTNNIERLILVGDYNQLPPIGPGKVYFDLIQYLKGDKSRMDKHLAELFFNWRQQQGSKSSRLAAHYSRSVKKGDEDIFSEIESGVFDLQNADNQSDLVIDQWKDDNDLINKLPGIIEYAVSRLDTRLAGKALSESYDEIHGIPRSDKKNIEAIHIISPYRHTPSGVDNINLEIQKILRSKSAKKNKGYVFCDKVMQVKNFDYYAWDHEQRKKVKDENTYVPNGTLGFVYPSSNKEKDLMVKFPAEYNKLSYYLTKKQTDEMLELGYATTVHKAQGSQFDVTIMIIPEDSEFLNREMIYTALTRSRKCQIILIQKSISLLKSRLWFGYSDIVKRNSSLFNKSYGLPPGGLEKYKPENLIYEALPELFVRSRGELAISRALADAGIGFSYEKPLPAKDGKSFKLPDFTLRHNRKEYYWEHKGMMDDTDYVLRDEKKTRWYVENGYQDKLIETPLDGMNLEQSIKYIFEKILVV